MHQHPGGLVIDPEVVVAAEAQSLDGGHRGRLRHLVGQPSSLLLGLEARYDADRRIELVVRAL
jgi:hypothetical protein